MVYMGVDPGASGGIAVLNAHGHVERVGKMPATDADLLAFLRPFSGRCRAVVERAHGGPLMGRSSAFRFGRSFGAVCMALLAAEIPYTLVTPKDWVAGMGMRPTKVKSKNFPAARPGRDKNVGKRKAQRMFPRVPVTLMTADALLLAEYCRRTEFARSSAGHKEMARGA